MKKPTSKSGIAGRARADIIAMAEYASARSLVANDAQTIFLDANECSYEAFIGAGNLARYSAQQPKELVRHFCEWLDVSSRNLIITRGADEAIECLFRAFCEPAIDNVIICPPTFAMYAQSAILQGIECREAPLTDDFGLDLAGIDTAADKNTKLVFVCSPNNPTANVMDETAIISLCERFEGQALVVVDETYIDYAIESGAARSLIPAVEDYDNLVILRTLSKSHAAAGLRCGGAIGSQPVTQMMRKVLAPYPIPQPVIANVGSIMAPSNQKRLAEKRRQTIARRNWFCDELAKSDKVERVLPSDANFVLVKARDAAKFCGLAQQAGIILRNQSHQPRLENMIRISIGSDAEMQRLLDALNGNAAPGEKPGRTHKIIRKTSETAISVTVDLDRAGPNNIQTGIGFYDHMLDQIAKHGGFAMTLECDGDLHIDPHHTIEDCAIAIGQAIRGALGDKRGIGRYGFCLPMDEALVTVALDLSGRFYLDFEPQFPASHVGDLPTDMVRHIFYSLAENMQANLHIAVTGENCHHMVEACFKGFGRALRQATRMEGSEMPSTKGSL